MRRWLSIVLLSAVACSQTPSIETTDHFRVVTESFDPGGTMPSRFTCDGGDVSPSLGWENLPSGTKSIALTMTDLNANGFVHWVALGIPADIGHFGIGSLPSGAVEG